MRAWHSSIIYTLYLPLIERSEASLTICFTLSTPLLDAPSISIGVPIPLFIAFAKIRATVVFPHPDAPQKRYVFLI